MIYKDDLKAINEDDFYSAVIAKDERQIIIMTIEEMAELTQALTKYLRSDNTTKSFKEIQNKILEEYSDVRLMLLELATIDQFDISLDKTDEIINSKLDRWLKRNGLREDL